MITLHFTVSNYSESFIELSLCAEEAESFGVNGGWDTFTIIHIVKLVKTK